MYQEHWKFGHLCKATESGTDVKLKLDTVIIVN